MIHALGAAFADDPFLEAVKTAESAVGRAVNLEPEYSNAAYVTALNLRIDAFPNTVTALYLNWLPGGDTPAMLDEIAAHAREHHVGLGGPDVDPTR